MKKVLLTSASLLLASGMAFAQGVVSWSTIIPTDMTAQTNSVTYSSLTGGGSTGAVNGSIGGTSTTASSFYYELLYNTAGSQQSAPTTTAGLATWADAGLGAVNNTGTAGRLTCLNPTTAATVPWAQGTTYSIMLVGWSANLGTTWSTVANELQHWATAQGSIVGAAFFGESATGYITPNTSPASGASLWGNTANANGTPIFSPNTQLYQLATTPEPGTIALAAIGGASLLLFRRKK